MDSLKCQTSPVPRQSRGISHSWLINSISAREFLVGNPGWQGSNTFVDLGLMLSVGGFREGMSSCNDRDLAIRLLRATSRQPALPAEWTASWHIRSGQQSISTTRNAKLSGLSHFWRLYGNEMNEETSSLFFERSHTLFGIEMTDIVGSAEQTHALPSSRGDLQTMRSAT